MNFYALLGQLALNTSSLKYMLKLSKFFLIITNEENIDAYDAEVRKLHSNSIQFPPFDEKENRIDVWYSSNIFKGSYSVLSRVLKSCMSCFHGPQVESSFNIMSDVIDIKSGNMSMKTFDAYQTIRYGLSAVSKTATEFFKKEDFLRDSVKSDLTTNVQCE